MTINLERRAFIASLHELFKGNTRKATDFYNELYYPDRIVYQTIRRIWKENNFDISLPGWCGNYIRQKKKRRVINIKNANLLKYLHVRGKYYK